MLFCAAAEWSGEGGGADQPRPHPAVCPPLLPVGPVPGGGGAAGRGSVLPGSGASHPKGESQGPRAAVPHAMGLLIF